jgi:Zn-dependent membrane protease YugP
MPLFFWDPTYVIILPDIVLAFYTQLRIQCAYGRYSRVPPFRKLKALRGGNGQDRLW